MSSRQRTFVEELGAALREVRWRSRVSQRELAERLGVSKTWVARLESGEVSAALTAVSRLVDDLGLRVSVGVDDDVLAPRGTEDATAGAAVATARTAVASTVHATSRRDDHRRDAVGVAAVANAEADGVDRGGPAPSGTTYRERPRSRRDYRNDEEAVMVVERWRERVDMEGVRDAAGRRLPAHLVAYPMSYPHHWWFLRHRGWSLRRRPIWSFLRSIPSARSVLQVGDNPPPMGLHPDGGWPLQGHPGPEIRSGWPPTFPVRPRRYADPLSSV